jgi:hypothetical protein
LFRCVLRRLSVLLFLCGCPRAPGTEATLHGTGFTVQVAAAPFSLTITGDDGATRLSTASAPRFTFDEHVYETQLLPGWDGYKSHERPWVDFGSATLDASDATSATLTFKSEERTVTVNVTVDGHQVRYRQSLEAASAFNKAALAFTLEDDAHFFGLGQRTASVDHRGHLMYSWPEEGGLGGGESTPAGPDNGAWKYESNALRVKACSLNRSENEPAGCCSRLPGDSAHFVLTDTKLLPDAPPSLIEAIRD